MNKGGGSLHCLENILGLARFRVFVLNLLYYYYPYLCEKVHTQQKSLKAVQPLVNSASTKIRFFLKSGLRDFETSPVSGFAVRNPDLSGNTVQILICL